MNEEKQQQMETRIRDFIDKINAENSDTMCGLIKPSFVSCDYEKQTLTMSYPAQYWEQNPIGRMQGGVIGAMLDFTAGCLSVYQTDSMALTVSMQVSYLRPGPLDGNLIVRATSTKAGRTLCHDFVECWCEGQEGKTVATANIVYMAQ